MPPARHRCPSRLLLPATALALAITLTTATPPAPAADPPPTVAAPEPSDLARLFKFHAGGQARALSDAIERAGLDETSRLELRLLVREHLRRVDEGASRASSAPGAGSALDDLLDRATGLARDFNDRRISAWLDDHPAAFSPVQEQIALAEAYERSAAAEPDAVVRAARRAGLASEHEAALRRTITDAHDRLARANSADARRLREAEEQAAATLPPPPADAPGPPGNGARDAGVTPRPPRAPAERASDPPDRAAPRPPAPALSPEVRRLQLLDALAFADAQTRAAAAGRDVRAQVEKLLTSPEHRKAMDAEMFRWYESPAPAGEPPPDDPPPADKSADKSPDANAPRPAPAKPSPRNDPRD